MCTGAEGAAAGASAGSGGYASLAGAGISALGGMISGKEQQAYYNYKAAQTEADAEAERQMGEVRAGKIRKAGKVTMGAARAAQGASGVDVNSGGALNVQANITRGIESDALTEILTGQRKAASMEATAQGYRSQAAVAERDAMFSASKSLLGAYASNERAKYEQNRYKPVASPTSSYTIPIPQDYGVYF